MQDLSVLTEKQKHLWTEMMEYQKNNPGTSDLKAVEETGHTGKTYYAAKYALGLQTSRGNLSIKQQHAYDTVRAYLELNPDATIAQACRENSIKPSAYSNAISRLNALSKPEKSRKSKPLMISLPVSEEVSNNTKENKPKSLRAMVNQLFELALQIKEIIE